MIPEKTNSRITLNHIYHVALDVLSFEKGLLYTYKEIIKDPGKSIYDYLFTENRTRYNNPLKSVLIITGLSTLCLTFFGFTDIFIHGFEAGWSSQETKNAASEDFKTGFLSLFLDYPTIFALFWIPINSLLSLVVFRQSKLYFAEYFVINSYLLALQNSVTIGFSVFAYLTVQDLLFLAIPLSLVLQYYVYYEFYRSKMKVTKTGLKITFLTVLSLPIYIISIFIFGAIYSKVIVLFV